MVNQKIQYYLGWVGLVAATFLDRFLKVQSQAAWASKALLGRWFGWYPFLNPGIAFGIPLPLPIMITFCAVIICALMWFMVTRRAMYGWLERLGLAAVLIGACSNVFDRVMYHATVDYILILTGVFNIADFLIIAGFVLLIWKRSNKPT